LLIREVEQATLEKGRPLLQENRTTPFPSSKNYRAVVVFLIDRVIWFLGLEFPIIRTGQYMQLHSVDDQKHYYDAVAVRFGGKG